MQINAQKVSPTLRAPVLIYRSAATSEARRVATMDLSAEKNAATVVARSRVACVAESHCFYYPSAAVNEARKVVKALFGNIYSRRKGRERRGSHKSPGNAVFQMSLRSQ